MSSVNIYNHLETILKNIDEEINRDNQDRISGKNKDEENWLNKYGVSEDDYKKAFNNINAEFQKDRKTVMTELQKLINEIEKLAPKNYQSIISDLFSQATNIKTIQELFQLFTNKIDDLLKNSKSADEQDIEKLVFLNSNYKGTMAKSDYEALVSILEKHKNDWHAEATKNGNQTKISFKIGDKNYTFTTNINVDISTIQNSGTAAKTEDIPDYSKPTADNIAKLEEILQDFVEGRLPWNKLASKLKPFGINEQTVYNNTDFKNNGKTYAITVTFGGHTYKCECSLAGANDKYDENGTTDKSKFGSTYEVFSKNALSGLNKEIINKFFTPVMTKDGQALYYTINPNAWEEIGANPDDGIEELTKALAKAAEEKIIYLLNAVVGEIAQEHNFNDDEVKQLENFLIPTNQDKVFDIYNNASPDGISFDQTAFTSGIRELAADEIKRILDARGNSDSDSADNSGGANDTGGATTRDNSGTSTVTQTVIDWQSNDTSVHYAMAFNGEDNTPYQSAKLSELYNKNGVINLLGFADIEKFDFKDQAIEKAKVRITNFTTSIVNSLKGNPNYSESALEIAKQKVDSLYKSALSNTYFYWPGHKEDKDTVFLFEGKSYKYRVSSYWSNNSAKDTTYSQRSSASRNELGLRIGEEYDDGEYQITVSARCVMDLFNRFYQEALQAGA